MDKMNEDPSSIGAWEKKCNLGEGSFGQVTLWQNKKQKEHIAIKKFSAFIKEKSSPEILKLKLRWQNEIDIMRKSNCDYIVRSINVEPNDFITKLNASNSTGFPLLIMEYCEGGDLRKYLNKIENSNGLIEYEVKNILKSLRYAIQYLHNINITHRDLKPENILIQIRNGVNFYKLADLGYAKEIQMTFNHSCVGTLEYVAPEIITSPEYSKTVDYWSMAIIIFEIICGIRPFLPNSNMTVRIAEIKNKSSRDIAILETNIKSIYKKFEYLFKENQITDYFRIQIEKWFIISLEVNPRQRGMEKNPAPDEIQKLPLFYKIIDDMLKTKILTIFCLSTYKFLSYPVNQMTNLIDLLNQIEIDSGIPATELYIILPIENTTVEKITQNTKPIDFYLDEQINSPMIYVTQYKHILERKSTDPHIPELIRDILEKPDNKLELSCLKEFARQVLFLHRNEQNHYVQLLKGLKTYAINLNDSIVKSNAKVFESNNKTIIACANIRMHVNIISRSKDKLEEDNMLDFGKKIVDKWNIYIDNMEHDYKLQEINARNQKRFDSVLRRSIEAMDSKFLTITDFYNVKTLEEIYDRLRSYKHINEKLCMETQLTLIKRCYDCLKRRKELLKSKELEHIQKNIIDIHLEIVKIIDIVKTLNERLDSYEIKIQQATFEHQDELCKIYEDFTKQKVENELKNVYRLNGVIDRENSIINANVNQTFNNNPGPIETIPNVLNGEQSLTSLASNTLKILSFGGDAKDIIDENIDLMRMLSKLSQNSHDD